MFFNPFPEGKKFIAMKKYLLLLAFSLSCITYSSGQIICIFCYDQNDSISDNVNNFITNGSFENSTCIPDNNANTWCPNSSNYNCDLAGWTCTGGGTATYCQLFDNAYSAIPDGIVAAYFGNNFCNPVFIFIYNPECTIF